MSHNDISWNEQASNIFKYHSIFYKHKLQWLLAFYNSFISAHGFPYTFDLVSCVRTAASKVLGVVSFSSLTTTCESTTFTASACPSPPGAGSGIRGLAVAPAGMGAPAPKRSVSLVISRERLWWTLAGVVGSPVILVREWRLFWGFVWGAMSSVTGDPSLGVLTGWAGCSGGKSCSGNSWILG